MKKVLFIDRDGTLILEPKDKQIDSFEKLEFYPNAIGALKKITEETDFELVMVSNQDGLGTDSFPEDRFWPVQDFILQTYKNEGVIFSKVFIDRSFPEENLPTRKPRTGLLTAYMKDYDLANSYVIGDRETDIELAKNMGCKSIFISSSQNGNATFGSDSWSDIARFICRSEREIFKRRKTSETDVQLTINLNGTGQSEISTGISFLDHMIEQVSRHSLVDIFLTATGDLNVDEHHTIEDTAIVLGEAFNEALGNKNGIERFGFSLPMDDCLAQVALDFSGRPWLVWSADFKRERIGDMPTEMFAHFFKSFSDSAKCTLHISAEGGIEHHKIEAIFKAFGRSIKQAVAQNGKNQMPSTKGVL